MIKILNYKKFTNTRNQIIDFIKTRFLDIFDIKKIKTKKIEFFVIKINFFVTKIN